MLALSIRLRLGFSYFLKKVMQKKYWITLKDLVNSKLQQNRSEDGIYRIQNIHVKGVAISYLVSPVLKT